ncbi:hypothetical protein [Mesonia sp. K7]|uniref:hypothetical protein n=1 Tax=Mesonia sp. K7 TaxID=2218606 RepID=UPI000DAA491F|nr:hypothetical protein [Mesonia sp. K7]PZD78982.1 hypothetical protein DNG35_02970 [Mesonia sp. K7]
MEEIFKKIEANLKYSLPIGFLCIFLFITGILFHRLSTVDKTLRKPDKIDLLVDDVFENKGFLTFNDSIVVSMNTTNINNPKQKIGYLNQPFRIIKKAHDDTIKIIKDADTLYFKLIDPDEYDPNDPSIKEALQHLFQ